MTSEISNKALAILLVGAIVVSLMGTFISINRLDNIQPGGFPAITGLYTYNTSGTVTLDVSGQVSFRINTNIDFGSITPNSSGFWITTNTSNDWAYAAFNQQYNCTNITGSCHGIVIENDGNEMINLSFNTTSQASTLIGGTLPSFQFLIRNGNRSGKGNEAGCAATLNTTHMVYTEISPNTIYDLCNGTAGNGFNYVAGSDKMTMEFNLTIPGDAPQVVNSQATIFLFN